MELRPLDYLLLALCALSLAMHLASDQPMRRQPRNQPRAPVTGPQRWVL